MTRRADVVIARFPYVGGQGYKVRPAVLVQCDRLNQQIQNTLLAMITGNTRLVGREPTQFLIDPNTPEGVSSGLSLPSAVKCENIATVPQQDLIDTIGHLYRCAKTENRRVPEGGAGAAIGSWKSGVTRVLANQLPDRPSLRY